MSALKYIITIASFFTLNACTQNDGYLGNLWGKWQLRQIVNGDMIQKVDTIFFNFQSDVISLQRVVYNANPPEVLYGQYAKTADSLFIYMRDEEDDSRMPLFGLKSRESSFRIQELSDKKLIITYKNEFLIFRKY